MSKALYPVEIFDTNFIKLAEVDDYQYFSWSTRWQRPDSFELVVNRNAHGAQHLKPGNIIVFQRRWGTGADDREIRGGIIGAFRAPVDDRGKVSENWRLAGNCFGGRFKKTVVLDKVNDPAHGGYDVQTGPAETVMRHFVNVECINPRNPYRRQPSLVLAPDQGRGPVIISRGRLQNLADLLESICMLSGLGWSVEIDLLNKLFVFTVHQSRDLTPGNLEGNNPVTFSTEFGNVQAMEYNFNSLDTADCAIVCGQGEGHNRVIIPVYKGISTRFEYVENFTTGNHDGTETDLAGRLTLPLGEKHETDFSEYTPGVQPHDWSEMFIGSSWIIEDGVLKHTSTVNADKNLVWDTPGEMLNAEVVIKAKASTVTYNQIEVSQRVSGTADYENKYMLELYGGREFYVSKNVDGVYRWFHSCEFIWYADTWYWIKFRVNERFLKAKVWEDGDPEPEEWQIDEVDADRDANLPPTGKVGVGNYTAGVPSVQRFAYFSVQEIVYQPGTYYSQDIDYSSAKYALDHLIKWEEETPEGTSVTVEHSLNGGPWLPCTNGGPIPGINHYDNLEGVKGKLKIILDNGGMNYAPSITAPEIWINGLITIENAPPLG